MSVNVTASQFKNNRLLHDINKALAQFDLPAKCLEIELTEQTLIKGSQEAFFILNELKKKSRKPHTLPCDHRHGLFPLGIRPLLHYLAGNNKIKMI